MLVAPAREMARVEMPDAVFAGSGTPCAFSGLSGFFHPAKGTTGVVLCAPWGFEELALRRGWRCLAESIAAAGYPCLRFDYPGTGNSIGAATDARATGDWVGAIDTAIEYVRGNAGVRRFVLVGQSLGAALAIAVANLRDDVIGLHLITPVVEGENYLRDLAAVSRQVADRLGQQRDQADSFTGFALSAAMKESLKGIDLRALDRLGAESVVVYDRLERRECAQFIEQLRRLGARVDLERVTPAAPVVSDTTICKPPPVDAERLVAKMVELHHVFTSQQPAAARMLPSVITADTFREQPVHFGPDQCLFGVLCRPSHERADTPAVLLLDGGRMPHVGYGRRGVDQARALAASGIASLRIDLAGIGESRDATWRASHPLQADLVLADVMAAVDVLAARNHRRIMLAGVSNGAYLALAAAQADPRVTDVIAANTPCFVRDPKDAYEAAAEIGTGLRAVVNLVRHRQPIVPALRPLARRGVKAAAAQVPLRLRAMLPRDPMVARVEQMFTAFADRGTRVSLIYGAGDPSLVELRTYFGPNGIALTGHHVTVTILPEVDQLLTPPAAGAWLLDHMIDVAWDGRHQGTRPAARQAFTPQPAVCPT